MGFWNFKTINVPEGDYAHLCMKTKQSFIDKIAQITQKLHVRSNLIWMLKIEQYRISLNYQNPLLQLNRAKKFSI